MYHSLSSWAIGKVKDIEESTEESKRLHKIMWNIYKANTAIPKDKLDDIYKSKIDWFITSDQAKKFKIISKIL
jgi:ATP-dependent protease ClpP protease subunit